MRGTFCALAALLLLAGCVTPPPDAGQPDLPALVMAPPLEVYQDAKLLDLAFPASDGTVIRGTAYIPQKPLEGHTQADSFGVIVNLSPYYGNAYGIGTHQRLDGVRDGKQNFNESRAGMFLAHGFAYVAASVPGTGKSGGCFGLGGLQEQKSMAEFIDWVGTQPWSNGNVGMTGGSYDGTTQWMAAIHAPKHLKTIVPHVSITDFYEYEYQDGAPYQWWGPAFTPYYLVLVGWGVDPFSPNPDDPLGAPWGIRPEADLLAEDLCPDARSHVTEAEAAYATGVRSPWWQERDYRPGIPNLNASVLMVHGFQDWNVKPIHLDGVWDLIPTEKRFWLQQMQHNAPWHDTYRKAWSRPDWNATLLAWYDHYLNGAQNGIPGALPGAWTQDQTGHWRTEEAWPPKQAKPLRFHLGAKSLTADDPGVGQTVFVTPPSYTGFLVEPTVGVRGPDAPDEVVAKFYTEPLAEPLRISGVPRVDLNLSVDRPGYPHIVAQLYAKHENGTWEWLDMGGRGVAQRESREADDPVQPREVMHVPVRLNPTETYIPAGSQLVLLLSGDDPDWFHPNGNFPTVFLEQGTSVLTVPVLPADTPRGLAPDKVALTNPFYKADPKQF